MTSRGTDALTSTPPATAAALGVIGVVGAGRIGLGICTNLVEHGVTVLVYDAAPAALESAVAIGANAVANLADLGTSADIVVLSLPTSLHVEAVVLGTGGLLDTPTRRLHTIVDTTSGDPLVTRRVADIVASQGVGLVDVGVSGAGRGGGVTSARAGTLKLMIGGDEATVARLAPLFNVMGGEIVGCGASGAGHAMKSLHNLRAVTITAVTAEILQLGTALGLDVSTLSEVLGAPPVIGELLKDPTKKSDVGFALALASKDCDIGIGLAHATGVTMIVATAAANAARAASADEGPDADYHSIVDAVARWSRRPRTVPIK
jgi:3-hydroxyisobutyrate dehydrogenase-like beta-hydroxyacid dehydrogenase